MAEAHLQDDQRQARQDELAACLARAATLVAELSGDAKPSPPEANYEWPKFPDHPDLITPSIAAIRADVDAATMRKWCVAFDIGRKYGGSRWRVSVKLLQAHLGR